MHATLQKKDKKNIEAARKFQLFKTASEQLFRKYNAAIMDMKNAF